MIVSVEEMKQYLRVDFDDDDTLLEQLIGAGENLCMDIARMDDAEKFSEEKNARIAVMYAVAYQYEHREDADHHALVLSLRSLLFGIRKEGF
ncbi:head-tail connector protein [Robinsoniella peoriensis]|uniref:head-tail connector protein n=1 Tax=Robinsoniella peoriensis TaxID=180332 RepID=UPI0036279C12